MYAISANFCCLVIRGGTAGWGASPAAAACQAKKKVAYPRSWTHTLPAFSRLPLSVS